MLICCMEGCEFNNSISNDEHVRCWLCDEYAHAKCAGITDSVVEMIEGRTGLKWTCETCRVVKSQMGRFMKQTRTEITELFREVRAVYEKLAKLESHITSRKIQILTIRLFNRLIYLFYYLIVDPQKPISLWTVIQVLIHYTLLKILMMTKKLKMQSHLLFNTILRICKKRKYGIIMRLPWYYLYIPIRLFLKLYLQWKLCSYPDS